MAVLEVEGVEELLGALGGDFGERLLHGERGAGVLGHGVGEDFGVGAVDGVDVGLGRGGRGGSFIFGDGGIVVSHGVSKDKPRGELAAWITCWRLLFRWGRGDSPPPDLKF